MENLIRMEVETPKRGVVGGAEYCLKSDDTLSMDYNVAIVGATEAAAAAATSSSSSSSSKRGSSVLSAPGDDRCPICLQAFTDAAALNCCEHSFCYDCIVEWTRMKPECPLCKRGLEQLKHGLILHNGEKASWAADGRIEEIAKLRSEYEMNEIFGRTAYPADIERAAVVEVIKSLFGELTVLQKQTYSTSPHEASYRSLVRQMEDEVREYKCLYDRFPTSSRKELFNDPSFRRVVYLQNLMPRSICPPRFGYAFNAAYVRSHPALVRRQLYPYIVRELYAITRRPSVTIDDFLEMLIKYFTNRVNRPTIASFLSERGIRNPHHFLNNLTHFVASGQSLEVYEQNSEYIQRNVNYMPVFQPEDDDIQVVHESEMDVQVLEERPITRHRTRNNNITVRQQPCQQQSNTSAFESTPITFDVSDSSDDDVCPYD